MSNLHRKPNYILLIIIVLLFLLLLIILAMLNILKNDDTNQNQIYVDVNIVTEKEQPKTAEDVITSYGSKYINQEYNIFTKIYVDFKYDLFDEEGKSRKSYFYNMIADIVDIEKDTFYLIDKSKKIEIYVVYDKEKETHRIIINNLEDYYDNTNGEIYVNLNKTKIADNNDLTFTNSLLLKLSMNNLYYSNTYLLLEDKVELEDKYYSYRNGQVLAKLQSGRALNIIFGKDFSEEIAPTIYLNTPLEDIYERYPEAAFGSVKDGYLGYKTDKAYMYFYENEFSFYGYQYEYNEELNQYISDYCQTGNLEKLYTNCTKKFTNYFENEYNPENQNLKLTYPTRGIEIDIQGNDSRGIKIYNNYYLTETIKELIKSNRITLEADKDLIHITEQTRRENSR